MTDSTDSKPVQNSEAVKPAFAGQSKPTVPKQELKPWLNKGGNDGNAFGGGMHRSAVRDAIGLKLTENALPLIDSLIERAMAGKLRDADAIKLIDILAKYSIGSVQSTEITGAEGSPIQVNFSFGRPNVEAKAYLEDVRNRLHLLTQATGQSALESQPGAKEEALELNPSEPDERTQSVFASDNTSYDALA